MRISSLACHEISYLVVLRVLSRMVKVRGACDKPFLGIYTIKYIAPPQRGKSDDVLVVE